MLLDRVCFTDSVRAMVDADRNCSQLNEVDGHPLCVPQESIFHGSVACKSTSHHLSVRLWQWAAVDYKYESNRIPFDGKYSVRRSA